LARIAYPKLLVLLPLSIKFGKIKVRKTIFYKYVCKPYKPIVPKKTNPIKITDRQK
jgi:hypothetical protein